jgi:hypothetical protein
MGSHPVFGGVRVEHLFSVLFCFVCLRSVSYVSIVVSVFGLSILDCPLIVSLTVILSIVVYNRSDRDISQYC